jgi:1,4-dihydroxy-2-naphthoate octaprenyltransferase
VTTVGQWVQGARPRTLPAALAPVLAGTGAAAAAGDVRPGRALLALVVALALQVAVNYANDYSDGIRGTDAQRVGPLRLVGSGVSTPAAVKRAAAVAFAVAAVAGLVLAALTTWVLIVVGAVAMLAAWFYTGGSRPYGYRALGEISVFVFFGLVATVGTAYVQVERVTGAAAAAGIGCGALACALLVANNLRDIPTDSVTGKRTLAVVLGDRTTRTLYLTLVAVPLVVAVVLAFTGTPWTLLALAAAALALRPARIVAGGAVGRDLVPVLRDTGRLQLAYAVLLAIGLALA